MKNLYLCLLLLLGLGITPAQTQLSGSDSLRAKLLPAGLYNVRAGKGQEALTKHIEITH